MDREAVLVGLATYNERENLPSLVAGIFEALPAAHIFVIDDASPDGTSDWCAEYAAADQRLTLLRRPSKLGLGSAHGKAMEWAIQHQYHWLITMDADGSHDPRHLSMILRRVRAEPRCDVVIGSRYCPGGTIQNWPWRRRITSRWVNHFARRCLRLPTADCSSAFRCYRVDCLRQLPAGSIRATGFAFFEESLWQLQRHGFQMAEVPIAFVDRQRGASKADWRTTVRAGSQLLKLAWRAQWSHRPPRS